MTFSSVLVSINMQDFLWFQGWKCIYLWGISQIFPSVLSVAPHSISVCCRCVLCCTNRKQNSPPLPQCVAFHHCLVPRTLPSQTFRINVIKWGEKVCPAVGSVACVGIPPPCTSYIFLSFFFLIIKAFVLMLDLFHPLSPPLPLTSLHSDSNPPCQPCC